MNTTASALCKSTSVARKHAFALIAAGIVCGTAHAQVRPITDTPKILSEKPDRTVIALEYLPAAGSTQKAGGLGVYRISEDGPGFYMQFITDLTNEGPRTLGDPARFPEPANRQFTEVTAINLGATARASSALSFFGGIGLVSSTPVTEKNDRVGRLSSSGRYYVEDTSRRENRLGVQVGVLYRVGSLSLGSSINSEIGTPQFSVGIAF